MFETTFLTTVADITQIVPTSHVTLFVLLILSLFFLTAIIAGAEVAFFTLNAKDINYLKTKERPGANLAIQLLDKPELLSTTLKASKITLAIAFILVFMFLVNLVAESQTGTLTFLVTFLLGTFLLLLFAEVLPKVYARQNNVRLVLFAAPIVKVMYGIFSPAAELFLQDSHEYKNRKLSRNISDELDKKQFELAVERSIGHTATKEEVDIFKGILNFGKITVKQIMHPRLDVSAIRYDWSFDKVKEHLIAAGFSRMPVYHNNIDEIAGMVHTKDFLPYTTFETFDWHSLIRPAYFIHQHKLISDLLNEFQEKRVHFAIVVDEYGGTSGIVTLEDIMEEIMGEIRDEYDEDELNYRKIDNNNFIFEGKMLLNDMCRVMGISSSTFEKAKGNSDSLAGLVLEIAGKFPKLNERVSYKNFDFTILSIDKLKIEKVKVEATSTKSINA